MPESTDKNTKPSKDKEVLDLLQPAKKKARKKKAAAKKKTAAKKAAAKKTPAAKKKKSVDVQKSEALNLFEDKPKKPRRKVESTKTTDNLPPISKVRQLEKEALFAPVEPEPEPESALKPESADPADVEIDAQDSNADSNIIHIKPPILVKELAESIKIKPHKLIAELLTLDVFASGPTHALEPEIAAQVCENHGFEFEKEKREKGAGVHKTEEVVEEPPPPIEEEQPVDDMQLRAPIITFMGHVDHGKTSLLDYIRKSRVTAGEAGGITQHIGAYSVETKDQRITFIDTPGHAAFTEMRARGANVTDIVVIVVAADDGIMPQTREAINHAKAAGVAIMIAINKCDLPSADTNRVKAQLQEMELTPEEWGGETICTEVSAITGDGVDNLLDLMALQAEVLELKSNPTATARATVIEAKLQPGRGSTATVIVQSGTLKKGMPFICGPYNGKIKSLVNDQGETITEAGPATPVEILGFSDVPHVGDEVVEMESDRAAKKLGSERKEDLRTTKLEGARKTTLETILESISDGEKQALKIILKGDVQGSVEAIANSLTDIESDKINLEIIHSDAGAITESDILLASASNAIVIGFNIKVENKAVAIAKKEEVQVKLFSIIYELIDQVKEAMLGMLDAEHRELKIGHARVKEVFKLTRGIVAGCVVVDGKISRKARARVLRGKQSVYDGGFATLRRFKEDVTEVRNGLECGIRLGNYNDYQEDDIIECYELEKLEKSL